MKNELIEADRCYSIVGAFLEVYHYFGPGLLEAVYAGALGYARTDRGHGVNREVIVDVAFKGRHVARHRLDMVVDDRVIVELKATEKLTPFAQQQIVSYLRATRYELGVLFHAGAEPRWRRFVDSRKDRLGQPLIHATT